jgi:hypothetical protein
MSRTEFTTLDLQGLDRTNVTWKSDSGSFRIEQSNEDQPFGDRYVTIDLSPREAADLVIFLTKYLFEYLE